MCFLWSITAQNSSPAVSATSAFVHHFTTFKYVLPLASSRFYQHISSLPGGTRRGNAVLANPAYLAILGRYTPYPSTHFTNTDKAGCVPDEGARRGSARPGYFGAFNKLLLSLLHIVHEARACACGNQYCTVGEL